MKSYRINKTVAPLVLCLLAIGSGLVRGHSRPSVEVVGEVQPKEPFVVRIVSGEKPITFCQRLNVSIPTPNGVESAPRPVEVEKLDEDKKKWSAYTANLPDIGVAFSAVSLKPQESQDFRLQVESQGEYRFKLRYVEGDLEPNCPELGKRQKRAVSQVIRVRQ